MVKTHLARVNLPVFVSSSVLIAVLLLFALIAPNTADTVFGALQSGIIDNTGWFYVLSVATVLVVTLYLGISRFGEIRLGPDHAQPAYSLPTWLAMLFSAGMGIGLMFFGVAEPLMHYLAPPTATPGSVEAVKEALKTSFFHWGFHGWAIYAMVALILAYFSFRHNLPLTLRSALYPFIGDKIFGWRGHIVDVFAVAGTIFGVATSLGFGSAQVNAGLSYLFGIDSSTTIQIAIMFAITLCALVSVSTGLDKGIRRLSEANMILAVLLLVFVLALGPSVFLLKAFVQNTGDYLSDIVRNTFNLFAYEKTDWIGGWTLFYWGWWLAWAPFVGLFIARISKGRTIREFVLGVLFVPTLFTMLWMTVFGNTAIHFVRELDVSQLADMVNADAAVGIFVFLEQFPFSQLLSALAVIMVVIFFVTSCDSGAMVVDMLCSFGNNDTPLWQRAYWVIMIGFVSMVLLFAGGLSALQTLTIASAFPFAIILLLSITGLMKSLRVELFKKESLLFTASPVATPTKTENWQERLKNIVDFPSRSKVDQFINGDIKSAMAKVVEELKDLQIEASVENVEKGVKLVVLHGSEEDFVYSVIRRRYQQPEFAQENIDTDDEQSYYRAEVHLREGGQDYDVMGWSTHAVINDIIDQYHKHQHFLHLMR